MKLVLKLILIGGGLVAAPVRGQSLSEARLDAVDSLAPQRRLPVLLAWQTAIRTSSSPYDSTGVRLVIDLARTYDLLDQTPRSVQLLQELVTLARTRRVRLPATSDRLIKAYYRLTHCQARLLRLSDARQYGQEGILLARRFDHSKWSSNLYSLMAYLRSTDGDYEQAVLLAEQGARLGVAAGDAYCTANGNFEHAKALRALERWQPAQEAIDRAIAAGSDSPELSLYYTVKASLYQQQQRFAQAQTWFERAISLNRTWQDATTLASNYVDLGYFYSETGRYPLAIQALRTALQSNPSPASQAVALDNLGMVYKRTGQLDSALITFQRAIGTLLPAYRPTRTNQWPALHLLRAAPNKEHLLPIIRNLADTWLQKARTGSRPTALPQALRTFLLADQLVDYMRWEQSGQQSKLYWRQKTRRLYEQALETCYLLNRPDMAYRFIEKSRAVLLTDNLNELGARQHVPVQWAGQEQALSRRVASLREQLTTQQPGSASYATVQTQLLAEQDKQDALVRQMAQTNPVYYHYRYDNAVRPLGEVSNWFAGRHQSLVSYFAGDSALYVLGVSPTGNRLIRQPIAPYTRSLQKWLTLLTNPAVLNGQMNAFWQTGSTVYSLLLQPLHLPPGRVVVSPDGLFIPLDALSRSAARPDYLVRQYAFSYVYSVNRMLAQMPVTNLSGTFVGMAPVHFPVTASQASLPSSDKSVQRIGDHFPTATLLEGKGATRSQFRRLAPSASVVQLYTHADADTLLKEPVLYFADSSLRLSELQSGPEFRTQLLVLSACRTGVGTNQRGEGVFSMARGFAALGVPSIVTTLWSVHSGPTYALTEQFFGYLADGLPRDVALQRAKQDWLARASRTDQLPDRWAGLILIGETQPLRLGLGTTAIIGIVVAVAGLLGLLIRRVTRQRAVETKLPA